MALMVLCLGIPLSRQSAPPETPAGQSKKAQESRKKGRLSLGQMANVNYLPWPRASPNPQARQVHDG